MKLKLRGPKCGNDKLSAGEGKKSKALMQVAYMGDHVQFLCCCCGNGFVVNKPPEVATEGGSDG